MHPCVVNENTNLSHNLNRIKIKRNQIKMNIVNGMLNKRKK